MKPLEEVAGVGDDILDENSTTDENAEDAEGGENASRPPSTGNLPLHVACQFGSLSVIQQLIHSEPRAAAVRNHAGQYPLQVFLQNRESKLEKKLPMALLEAYPAALQNLNLDSKNYPWIWSQLSPTARFQSLRSQPDLLTST